MTLNHQSHLIEFHMLPIKYTLHFHLKARLTTCFEYGLPEPFLPPYLSRRFWEAVEVPLWLVMWGNLCLWRQRSGWWRRRRRVAACPLECWIPAVTACLGERYWRSGRSSVVLGSALFWLDLAGKEKKRGSEWEEQARRTLQGWAGLLQVGWVGTWVPVALCILRDESCI